MHWQRVDISMLVWGAKRCSLCGLLLCKMMRCSVSDELMPKPAGDQQDRLCQKQWRTEWWHFKLNMRNANAAIFKIHTINAWILKKSETTIQIPYTLETNIGTEFKIRQTHNKTSYWQYTTHLTTRTRFFSCFIVDDSFQWKCRVQIFLIFNRLQRVFLTDGKPYWSILVFKCCLFTHKKTSKALHWLLRIDKGIYDVCITIYQFRLWYCKFCIDFSNCWKTSAISDPHELVHFFTFTITSVLYTFVAVSVHYDSSQTWKLTSYKR